MKLFTSYWAKVRDFSTNLIGLNTTVWPPKWRPLGLDARGVLVIDCPPLKPGHNCNGLCNGKCNPKHPEDCEFLREYRKQLDPINFNEFMQKLLNLRARLCEDFPDRKNFDFAFIFFEKYDNSCSERWPVQDWIRAHGLKIEEWHPNI